jgi:hypothetical protein
MTSEEFTVLSTNYLDSQETFTAILSLEEWTRLSDIVESPRLFANIHFPSKSIVCAITCLSIPSEFPKAIFLPEWMIPHGFECGNLCEITFLGTDAFPPAQHVVLRPLDSAFYNTDVKEELEHSLTKLGCLSKGQIVNIPLEALGGYEIPFFVVDLVPADCVLLDGDEISCEFEEALDRFDGRPPTPPPPPEQLLQNMVPDATPENTQFQGRGHRLGGVCRRMPDGRPWNPYRDSHPS